MQRVVSGITPSGSLHIGNYFGAVKNFLELQENAEAIFFIADLHALTTVHDQFLLKENILNLAIDYLSLGIDPGKSIFFRQSDVSAHPYLESILTNFTSLGLMKRAHAYKDKLEKEIGEEDLNMGLFCYPILMAADILLYKPDIVPVGKDQKQHIEITRDIAVSFNKAVGKDVLKVPHEYTTKGREVILGTDGKRKMSKSLGNVIDIFAEEPVLKKQIMATVTDPLRIHATDKGRIEGNVIFDYHDMLNTNIDEVGDLKKRYAEGRVGDVEVKEKLLAAHLLYFREARERRIYFIHHVQEVEHILAEGARKADSIASATLKEAKVALGI